MTASGRVAKTGRLIHFVAHDRAARLCFVQSTTLEDTRQRNAQLLMNLQVEGKGLVRDCIQN